MIKKTTTNIRHKKFHLFVDHLAAKRHSITVKVSQMKNLDDKQTARQLLFRYGSQ